RTGRVVLGGVTLILREHAVVHLIAGLAAVLSGRQRVLLVAATHLRPGALCIRGALGDDVDDSVDRVGSPERRAGTSDHLDPVDVLHEVVLYVPEHTGEERRINASPIAQYEQIGGVGAGEAAR